jgi:glutaredoxin
MTNIEFYYFDGCPSYKKALEYLKEIIDEENIDANLKLIRVESPKEAQKVGFQGSPSIKINGQDMEGKMGEISFTCRIYNIEGSLIGIPSKEYIREKILKYEKLKKTLDSTL